MSILVVIPARGKSKGIPRKNLRLLNGKPLIWYAINIAKKISNADVVVSTEDTDIKELALVYGVGVIERPEYLSEDNIPLDPVVKHALEKSEKRGNKKYTIVITLQPSSPLLKKGTLERAIDFFKKTDTDTLISCSEKRHLFWVHEKKKQYKPFYKERKNRQFLEPVFEETGAFLICKKSVLEKGSRIGKNTCVFPVDKEESVDIDSWTDWVVAESLSKRRKIILRVDGDKDIGLGHVYRCLAIADKLINHRIYFVMSKKMHLGVQKVKDYNYEVVLFESKRELFNAIDSIKPHIIINDILDTSSTYIQKLKRRGIFSVNFEDLGKGSEECDLLFNSLYEWSGQYEDNKYYGYKYGCIREEFNFFPVKYEVKDKVEEILIIFGGTDINDLTTRALFSLVRLKFKGKITVVLGLGYKGKNEIKKYAVKKNLEGFRIKLVEDTKFIIKHMYNADFAITSNGRTVYELASLGISAISISQNYRETMHLFSKVCSGVTNLGIANVLKDETLDKEISRLIDDKKCRLFLKKKLIPFAKDIKKGLDRLTTIIFEKYWEKENEKQNAESGHRNR